MCVSSYTEIVTFTDAAKTTRFGVVLRSYWESDGEIVDTEWIDTFDNRRDAEAVMLGTWVERCQEVAVMRER